MRLFAGGTAPGWCRLASWVVAVCATSLAPAFAQNFTALLGGSGQEYGSCVATDSQGNIFVAGQTYSADFPVTAGALQTKSAGNSDVFVAKFAANGTLLWSTYLGGTQDEWASGVAVDGAGDVIVTGWTRSGDFPLFHPVQSTLDNGASLTDYDAFVTKIDPTGTHILYSTFLGAGQNDGANAIAVDSAGAVYVTGQTDSANWMRRARWSTPTFIPTAGPMELPSMPRAMLTSRGKLPR